MKGWMYILECSDHSYYVGSTRNLHKRLAQHLAGKGANHTKKRLPVKLVYFEEFPRIDQAFYREKQVQRWSRKKKEALINGRSEDLKRLAECMNETHCRNYNPLVSATLVSATLVSATLVSATLVSATLVSATLNQRGEAARARCLSGVEGSANDSI